MKTLRIFWFAVFAAIGLAACGHASKGGEGRALSFEMAQVLVAHHAYEPAIPMLQRGLSEDPNNARLHLLLGVILRDRGLYNEARRELMEAVRLEPNDAETRAAWAVLLDMQGDGEEADKWHRSAIAMSGGRGDLYNNLGFSLYLRREYTSAIGAYRKALERDPGAHRVYNNLGFTYAMLGQYKQALQAFQQAGSRAQALSNLALAYELTSEPGLARQTYEDALRLDGRLKVARKNLQNLIARGPTLSQSFAPNHRQEMDP